MLVLLAQVLVLCTSTLVYILFSSYLASSCALFMKNDIEIRGIFRAFYPQLIPGHKLDSNLTTQLEVGGVFHTNRDLAMPQVNEFIEQEEIRLNAEVQVQRTPSSNKTYYDRICNLNQKIKSFLSLKRVNHAFVEAKKSRLDFYRYSNEFENSFNSRLVF